MASNSGDGGQEGVSTILGSAGGARYLQNVRADEDESIPNRYAEHLCVRFISHRF